MPCPQPDDPTPAASSTEATQAQCVRCRVAAATVHYRDSSYCQACGKSHFEQKAKPGLEAARGAGIARYIDRVARTSDATAADPKQDVRGAVNASLALAWSGGMSSTVLLRAAAQYFRPEHERRIREPVDIAADDDEVASLANKMASLGRTSEVAKVYVIFVDDSAIIPGGRDRTEEARAIVEAEGCEDFEFVGLKLEDVYLTDAGGGSRAAAAATCTAEPGQERMLSRTTAGVEDPKAALRSLFASLHPDDTPRAGVASARTRIEDLHRILVHFLLRREANRRGCVSLMLGESGTRMSIRLIESLAKGGGHKLPVEGADAIWIEDLLVVRPLQPHLVQEVKFFAEANQLRWLPDQDLVPSGVSAGSAYNTAGEPVMDKSSIGRLTETFILNLERSVPSTVSTIGRTGSKLVLKDEAAATGPASAPAANAPASGSASAGFDVVGPSVPLGRKARKALAKGSGTSASGLVIEPRVGARGSRLAHTARNLPRWSPRQTRRACPLCELPAAAGAKDWKRDITISVHPDRPIAPSAETAVAPDNEADATIELGSLLCYACILNLETPERPHLVRAPGSSGGEDGAERPKQMLLPPHVVENALYRLLPPTATDDEQPATDHQEVEGEGEDPRRQAPSNTERGHTPTAAAAVPRKVQRSEMRQAIDEFLLPAEGEDEEA
ncbi:hypothetical protein ACQY0O_001278 [Thecaphora frezii]